MNIDNCVPQQQVPLASLTTLQVGGAAEFFCSIDSQDQLVQAYQWATEHTQPVTVLAGGSNVLVDDSGISGLVVHMNNKGREYTSNTSGAVLATFQAGEILDDVISETVSRGLWGLENLSGIPGSVGATPVQNVGAYGVEVADLLYSVRVFDTVQSTVSEWLASECGFSYRDSIFKNDPGRYVIVSVTFMLSTQASPQLQYQDVQSLQEVPNLTQADIRDKIIRVRSRKFPDWRVIGTAGSFFKNPIVTESTRNALLDQYPEMPCHPTPEGLYKLSLGWILDRVCNLRGYTKEPIGLYIHQALVLVNYGNASAEDIIDFASEVQKSVYEKTGLEIEYEVTRLANRPSLRA